jgi:hypothetical protein
LQRITYYAKLHANTMRKMRKFILSYITRKEKSMKRKRVSRIVGLLALALLLSTGQTVWGGEARLPADAPTSQPPLDLVQITHNSGEWEQIDPIRISGYGNRVAFFVHPLGGGARDLYVANADGSGSTQLVATNVMMTYLDISDDGKRILFVPWDDGSHGLKAMHAYLFLVDQHSYLDVTACITHPDGIHQRCLPPNPSVGYPGGALSGDGRQVFYTSDMPWDCEPLPDLPYWNCAIPYGPLRLWGVQVEDGQARCRTDPNSDLGDIGSVDASAQGGVSSIYAFDGTTKNVFLTFRNSYQTIDPLIYYPVLSRNGYFTAGTSQDRTELWQVPFRNGWYSLGDPRCIFTSDNVLLPLGFSRDGQRILFTEHCGSSECPYLINLDGGDRVPAVPEDWIGCHQPVLLWSSSLAYDVGETVAFVSDCDILGNGNTHLQIFVLGDPGHSTGWKEIPHYSNPPARSGHKMVKLPDGRVLLFGGQDGSAGLSDELFAFQEDSWTPITPANDPPPPRRDHAAVSVGDAVYIHGGLGEGGSTFDDLWRYNADDNSWEMIITIDPPPARSSHSAWSWNDAVYIAGGQDSGTNTLQDLWAYDLIANTWQRRADAPVGFHHAGMASDGRYVYVLGVEDMPVYDTQTDTWSLLPQGPLPEPRRSPAVAQNAYKAWMIGSWGTLGSSTLPRGVGSKASRCPPRWRVRPPAAS